MEYYGMVYIYYNIHGGFSIFMLVYWRLLLWYTPSHPQWRFQDGKKYSLTSKNHHFWIRLHEGAWWFDGSKTGVVILCSNTQIDRTVEQMELPYIHDMIGGNIIENILEKLWDPYIISYIYISNLQYVYEIIIDQFMFAWPNFTYSFCWSHPSGLSPPTLPAMSGTIPTVVFWLHHCWILITIYICSNHYLSDLSVVWGSY